MTQIAGEVSLLLCRRYNSACAGTRCRTALVAGIVPGALAYLAHCAPPTRTQVLSGETRFLRIRAYPEKIGAAARFWSISAHYRTVQYILYFSTFVLLLLLLFYGTSVKVGR